MPEVVRTIHIKKEMGRIRFEVITLVSTERAALYIPPFFIQEVQVIPEAVDGVFEQVHIRVFFSNSKVVPGGAWRWS
jgi:hypothetical protein